MSDQAYTDRVYQSEGKLVVNQRLFVFLEKSRLLEIISGKGQR